MDDLSTVLDELDRLIDQGRFEELESDTIELKPCPSSSQDWSERYRSVNAFLNTRGGVLILGVKEVQRDGHRRYELPGYDAAAEGKLKDMHTGVFTDAFGQSIKDMAEFLPPVELRSVRGKRVAIVRVDALPAIRRYVFFKGRAYKRQLTGDHVVTKAELDRQAEFIEEAAQARELQLVHDASLEDIDLDKLNEYIVELNRLQKIESLKPSLAEAQAFLERKRFCIGGRLTLLGALVCAAHPGDILGFRAHVHGYVNNLRSSESDTLIVPDKQDLIGNVLPLLVQANAFVLRNIQVGVSASLGGSASAQYPEVVLRETINNALAHRDYAINKQVVVSITPGRQIEITNPGTFRHQLLIHLPSTAGLPPVLRVLPETKPRNPRLADVLRVYRKWEGRGIGMATLVDVCLSNRLNLPYYRFKTDEVVLVLQAGLLVDSRLQEIFESRDAYIATKLGSFDELSDEKRAVLAYLIKSEWANQEGRHCVLLTQDNNHAQAIKALESAGLIFRHPDSPVLYPIYLADRNLLTDDFESELRQRYGPAFDELALLWRKALAVVYRYNHFSTKKRVSAKQASYALWPSEGKDLADLRAFDHFNRNIRRVFNQLEERGFIEPSADVKGKGYELSNRPVRYQGELF